MTQLNKKKTAREDIEEALDDAMRHADISESRHTLGRIVHALRVLFSLLPPEATPGDAQSGEAAGFSPPVSPVVPPLPSLDAPCPAGWRKGNHETYSDDVRDECRACGANNGKPWRASFAPYVPPDALETAANEKAAARVSGLHKDCPTCRGKRMLGPDFACEHIVHGYVTKLESATRELERTEGAGRADKYAHEIERLCIERGVVDQVLESQDLKHKTYREAAGKLIAASREYQSNMCSSAWSAVTAAADALERLTP